MAAQATAQKPRPTTGEGRSAHRSGSGPTVPPPATDLPRLIDETAVLLAQVGRRAVPPSELATARARLESVVGDRQITGRPKAEALRALIELHRAQSRRLTRRRDTAIRAISEIRQCVAGLDGMTTDELVQHIPIRLCGSLSFRRAMVSSVSGSVWTPRHLHIADSLPTEQQFLDYVATNQISLHHAPFESEAVRLRSPMLSTSPDSDQRTFKELVEISGCQGYIAAPIVSRGRTIGLLHVDQPDHGRISRTDAEIIGVAAECTSLLFEDALLRERLATSAAQIDEGLAPPPRKAADHARLNALLTGEVDFIQDLDIRNVPLIEKNPDFQVQRTPSLRHFSFDMDTKVTPFDNPDVRQALKYALGL